MALRNVYFSALIALIAANLILADDSSLAQPQPPESPRYNPFVPGPFGPNPSGSNLYGTDPAAPRPPGFNSPGFPFGFDYSQFVPSGFRNTRDVGLQERNNKEESNPSDSNPRISPFSLISQFLNSRQTRDVSSVENNNVDQPSGSEPSESSPSDSNPRFSPLSLISQFFNSRQTRDVSSQQNSNLEQPSGSEPSGSSPSVSNPRISPFSFISQFLNSRQTRDVGSVENNNLGQPSESNPDSNPRFSPLNLISQFFNSRQTRDVSSQQNSNLEQPTGSNSVGSGSFGSNPAEPRPPGFNSGFNAPGSSRSGFPNLRLTRDINSQEKNSLEKPSESSPVENSPSDSNPRVSPFSMISQFLPFGFPNFRQTRDVSSQENTNKEEDSHQRLMPFGSNPLGSFPFGSNIFGSLPFGSNPFGSLPFSFNISQFLPFGDSRQTRDVSSQESSTEDDPHQRLFFSLGSRLTTCNYTETPGISCANCFQALTCLPSNVGYIRRCTLYCNSGRCSFVAGSQCTNSTG